jgi:amino acid adenylation domain-containing protein
MGHLKTIVGGMVTSPPRTLADVPWITPAEQQQQLLDWNLTDAPYDQNCLLHEPFERQALSQPNAIALLVNHPPVTDQSHGHSAPVQEQITYGELNQRANQLAHYLRDRGIQPGEGVGVYLNRSIPLVVALLGILKAGGAYIPLEPMLPNQRVAVILADQQTRFVLSETVYAGVGVDLDLPTLEQWIALDTLDLSGYNAVNPDRQSQPDQTAYTIFTSGSTGTPKGVVVAHRSVINLIEWVNRTFDVGAADRLLFVTSICFDLSVYDLFGILAAGGSIHIATAAEIGEPRALIDLLNYGGITFWDSAPPALQRLAPLFPDIQQFCALRLVFMSGDWVPMTLPGQLEKTFPGAQLIALGGATEASVWSNYFEIGGLDPNWTSIPYGKPIQNAQYYVLDRQLQPCPIGVTGELYIGGDCLASGYSDPVKTAAQFIPSPLPLGGRLYRTGDLARFFPDGNIEFLGRIDHQVKIRGYRIELGEIEAVLAQHEQVAVAVTLARGSSREDQQLVAYVVPQPGQPEPSAADLQAFLRQRLPEYMIPAAVVCLEALPITANGKLDRTALPDPATQTSDSAFIRPLPGLERKLAELWEQVLGIAPIGRFDHFFEQGGHSLLAVQLVARIEQTIGVRLPIAALFQAPTVAQMAAVLQQSYEITPWTTISVRPVNGIKLPLFWCQGHVDLKPLLPEDQPLYGLESGILEIRDPATHIKTWAAGYVEQIRAIQPEGPYHLGGYCFGGYIALEVARQLRQQGHAVAPLMLLESYGPKIPYYQQTFTPYSSLLMMASLKRRLQTKYDERPRNSALQLATLDAPAQSPLLAADHVPHNLIRSAVHHYQCQPYAGEVALFASNISHLGSSLQPRLGWGKIFQGKIKLWKITGGHYGIFSVHHGHVLSQAIQDFLQSVHGSVEIHADRAITIER